MNERDLPQKIVRALDEGTSRIPQDTLLRLQTARNLALSRYPARESAAGLALASGSGNAGFKWLHGHRFWLPVAVLLLGLLILSDWQFLQGGHAPEDEEDAALLADDLPVHTYVDSGFEAWLKWYSSEQ